MYECSKGGRIGFVILTVSIDTGSQEHEDRRKSRD